MQFCCCKIGILVIDTQGALQLKDKIEATCIFIQPPGLDVLRERLTARGTESAEAIISLLRLTDYLYCDVTIS